MSILKLAKRALGFSGNSELLAIIENELRQPLCMREGETDAYVRAFLTDNKPDILTFGGGDRPEPEGSSVMTVRIPELGIGVLHIDGAMLAREIETPCERSPVSYEAIKYEMANMMVDDEISTIIGRFHSGGGVASQMVDLSDYIFSQRGKGKALYAMVDDKAYSSAYCAASAFDEIWITRTGGVGSIGIVARFEDHSERNKMRGVSVEYLYKGANKVNGNSDQPLTDVARAEMDEELEIHYSMFTSTTARNLGVSREMIVATEAKTYIGEKAITAGLAHKLGTFDDLINYIGEGKMSTQLTPEQIAANKAALTASLAKQQAEVAATQAALASMDTPVAAVAAVAAEPAAPAAPVEPEVLPIPEVAPAAVAPVVVGDTGVQATAREAGIRAVCGAAGIDDSITANFVASGMTLGEVQGSIAAQTANVADNASVTIASTSLGLGTQTDASAEAAKLNDAGWDAALKIKSAH